MFLYESSHVRNYFKLHGLMFQVVNESLDVPVVELTLKVGCSDQVKVCVGI